MAKKKDPRLARAGVSGYNKPKRTPSHPTKSHIVVAKEGNKIKTIRFGQQGAKTAGKPKAGESRRTRMKRKSFKARHRKNIAKGKMSAAYWANKVKWQEIMPIQRKGVTKGDMVRAIKGIELHLMQLQQHIVMIDNILDKYIIMKKDKDKFKKFMEDEHKQKQRKQSTKSTKTTK